ncbi:MAG TPA: sigma 54-interacting transcriptional regulator, partial [Byssovorax sp.]
MSTGRPRAPKEPSAPPPVDAPSTLSGDRPLAMSVTVKGFRLVVRRGPDQKASFTSKDERTVVGTHASCDLVLTDPTVSRFHCEILAREGRVEVRDLGSRNGTSIGGVPVLHALVPPRALLTLGNTDVELEPRVDDVALTLSERTRFGSMVGHAPSMRRVFSVLERAAASDVTVLLYGETGTGKELAAESIHLESARRDQPFVIVDCAAVPTNLLESELFGHEKGAFTGASGAREGAFEAAHGGTVFLDEIGELAIELQPKLLRVLERHEVKRVGGSRYSKVDIRVVAATNRNLKVEVNEKRFRSDLYYRLAVVDVRIPALRERQGDLPLLVETLLDQLGAKDKPAARELFKPAFVADLARQSWPGNVRELRNYLDRCIALEERVPFDRSTSQLGDTSAHAPELDRPLKVARERWSREFER